MIFLRRLFPERQILLRSHGEVRYLYLGTAIQTVLALVFCGALGALSYGAVSLYFAVEIRSTQEAKYYRLSNSYERLNVANLKTRANLDELTEALRRDRARLSGALGRERQLRDDMGTIDSALRQTLEPQDAAKEAGRTGALAMIAKLRQQRDQARLRRTRLQTRVEDLTTELGVLNQAQSKLVERMILHTATNVAELEIAVARTGVEANRFLLLGRAEALKSRGIGGPMITATMPLGRNARDPLINLEWQLARWEQLIDLMAHLPVMPPVDHYYVSSKFGKRRDPFTKRWAMHSGVDFSGIIRSPIYAVAPGQVTFVGWHGPYGRLVEIDHGYGIKTRYGHLQKILVKKWRRREFSPEDWSDGIVRPQYRGARAL